MEYQHLTNIKVLLNTLGLSTVDKGNRFLSRCPNSNHRDKKPSWTIYKNSGYHICFACGFQGSLNYLVKYLTGKTIWEYLQIGQPENYLFKKSLEDKKERKYFTRITTKVKESFGILYSVNKSIEVENYIKKREIDESFIEFFKIKWCKEKTYNSTTFRNRIIIPIYENKILISVEGRDFTGNQYPKVLYPKDATINTLFNIDNLDFEKPLIVVEGIMDVPKIWSNLSKNVTCTFGSCLTSRQLILLNKAKNLIMFPDNDEAGYNMIKQFDEIAEKEFEIAVLKESKDPGEASIDELKEVLDNRKLAVRYFMEKTGIVKEVKVEW